MALLETDPRDLLLDENNDLVITDDLQFSYGIPGIVQEVRIALQMFAGEWFLDLDAGIPYWQQILGEKAPRAMAAARIAFRDAILAVDGITALTRLDIAFNGSTRKMTVTWAAKCAFGETPPDTIALRVGGDA